MHAHMHSCTRTCGLALAWLAPPHAPPPPHHRCCPYHHPPPLRPPGVQPRAPPCWSPSAVVAQILIARGCRQVAWTQ
eukprot:1146976-Pelagomonas_calceolata.AAC.8